MNILNLGQGMNFDIKKILNMNLGMNNRGNNKGNSRCYATIISCDEAYSMIKNENNIMIIDVRNFQEYGVSHLKNSINIPVCNIQKCCNMLPQNKNNKILLYCLNGARAQKAASILFDMGYKNLYMWDGGSITTMPYGELIEYNK